MISRARSERPCLAAERSNSTVEPGALALGTPGRAEADHLPYGVGVLVGQPAGEQAAEAPPDEADRELVAFVELDERASTPSTRVSVSPWLRPSCQPCGR